AEDGIRDFHVTGVQTCALPIYRLDIAKDLIGKAKVKGVNLCIPIDAVIADKFANDANTKTVAIDKIPSGWMGLDIGPQTVAFFRLEERRVGKEWSVRI